ncbi:hypothetical protein GLP30_09585 [Photobacterium phosphoreum]|uniref:DUF2769 domain-containing protein n=1 Tax=Photobacterium phosphoreum TaxID=659 RepID=A0AAW4ZP26_PHOPO|nr:hypothetical protein [Photobacterium phosphoreum]MCD9491050.1 hypothetical protein [Photobacterium phosphoreum]MCF2190340.1 hypothetical protein [Photobacterium phosphoreum]MCF2300927.1 hypothetical protein [Photobacterium phosphoreum]
MKVILGPLVLCQDCLKQKIYTTERHVGDELCECGGDFCGCSSCNETLQALKAGKRTKEEVGTQSDVLSWNENQGVNAPVECRKYYYIYKNKFMNSVFFSNRKLTHLPESNKQSDFEFDLYGDRLSELEDLISEDKKYDASKHQHPEALIEIQESEAVNVAMQGIPMIFLD